MARRIVEVAGTVEVDRGDGDPDALEAARDAFVAPPATRSSVRRTLRISVAAGSRNRPPEGRSPDCYGSSPLAWTPYRPDADQPLVKAAEQVAERMKFRAVVDEFDPRSGQPDAPEILLLDRWVLRDAGQRAQLTKFDADTTRPAGLAVPWNDGDPDSIGVRGELAAEVDAVLPLRTSRQRQAGLGAALEIPDHRTFDTLLPKVVAWASKEYLRHATASPPPGRGTERFRVGDTDGAAGRPTDHRRNDEEEDRDGQP
nr:FxsC protein [Streptomyces sp. SID13726]